MTDPGPPAADPPAAPTEPAAVASVGLADIRRVWPDVLDKVKNARRFSWILLSQNAQVVGIEAETLTLGMKSAGARESFLGSGSEAVLQQALADLLGSTWTIETVVDPSADPGATSAPKVRTPAVAPDGGTDPVTTEAEPEQVAATPPGAQDGPGAQALEDVRSRIEPTRAPGAPRHQGPSSDADADVDRDDPDADDSGLDGQALLERELGARMIDEISNEADQ